MSDYSQNEEQNKEPKVRNCRHKFECDQLWGEMKVTGSPRIRVCANEIHLVKIRTELAMAIQNNRCVCETPEVFDRPVVLAPRVSAPVLKPEVVLKGKGVRAALDSARVPVWNTQRPDDLPAFLRPPVRGVFEYQVYQKFGQGPR